MDVMDWESIDDASTKLHLMYGLSPTTCPHLSRLRDLLITDRRYVHKLSRILDHLYLGAYAQAQDRRLLREWGITHVINCAEGEIPTGEGFYEGQVTYMGFDAEDEEDYNIMKHFDEVFEFIEKAREEGGKVLIHCIAGVNRSGALTVAYCMVHKNMGPIEASQFVRNIRPQILSNDEFRKQVIQFGKERGFIPAKEKS